MIQVFWGGLGGGSNIVVNVVALNFILVFWVFIYSTIQYKEKNTKLTSISLMASLVVWKVIHSHLTILV